MALITTQYEVDILTASTCCNGPTAAGPVVWRPPVVRNAISPRALVIAMQPPFGVGIFLNILTERCDTMVSRIRETAVLRGVLARKNGDWAVLESEA